VHSAPLPLRLEWVSGRSLITCIYPFKMLKPASILSAATAGFKLAFTLYALADAIGLIDTEIRRTAIEVSLFSEVLDRLG
jgi:hypothetical protein